MSLSKPFFLFSGLLVIPVSWTPDILSGLFPVCVSRFCKPCVFILGFPLPVFVVLFIVYFCILLLSVFRTSWLLILILCSCQLRPCLLSSDYLCFLCLFTKILDVPLLNHLYHHIVHLGPHSLSLSLPARNRKKSPVWSQHYVFRSRALCGAPIVCLGT